MIFTYKGVRSGEVQGLNEPPICEKQEVLKKLGVNLGIFNLSSKEVVRCS
jgi:hypothetical protein